jgi:casein kinase 1
MVIIGNKYEVVKLLGSGTFGKIYEGINIRTNELVAIKMEELKTDFASLKHETKIYQYLSGTEGLPKLKWYGNDLNHRYMVITLLGDNLSFLKTKYGFLSLEVTIQIGINALEILKSIHEKGLIHRDIKPDNFLFGYHENKNQLYLIDFGLCKRYVNDLGEHLKIKEVSKIIGSLNYCSQNSHLYNDLSRRDDLESLGYILIYLSLGNLPWEKITFEKTIKERKELLTSNISFPGIADVLIKYLKYVKKLEFNETPDYNYIKNLLLEY